MEILVIIGVAFIGYHIFMNAMIKRSKKRELEAQNLKRKEDQAEIERLLKSEFIKILHDKMYSECEAYMKSSLDYYLNRYQTRPPHIWEFLYVSEWHWIESAIWGSHYRSGDSMESRAHMNFKEFGYENLNNRQADLLGKALAAYSEAWKVKDENAYRNLVSNEEYWMPYIQEYVDKVCDERNIQALKKI